MNLCYMPHKYTVQREHRVLRLERPTKKMFSMKTIAVCCKNYTEHTDTTCGQNGVLLVTPASTRTNH